MCVTLILKGDGRRGWAYKYRWGCGDKKRKGSIGGEEGENTTPALFFLINRALCAGNEIKMHAFAGSQYWSLGHGTILT
jgi:hypothetical protein